jgi:DNA (cytosine-5)-methyltransferase 1
MRSFLSPYYSLAYFERFFKFSDASNDYSIVGEQKGMDGIFGPLYSYGIETLRIYRPKWFLAENVGGLRNANDGKAFAQNFSRYEKCFSRRR